MRRSTIEIPGDRTARPSTKRFLCAPGFWRICITLARRLGRPDFCRCRGVGITGQSGKFLYFLLPLAVFLAVLSMLGPTAICSTVFFTSSAAGFVASPSPFRLDGSQSTTLAAEGLSRMNGRKRTIARLPKAPTVKGSRLRYLPTASCRTRIVVGHAGGPSRGVKSRCRS
jgi:hypothetical protein